MDLNVDVMAKIVLVTNPRHLVPAMQPTLVSVMPLIVVVMRLFVLSISVFVRYVCAIDKFALAINKGNYAATVPLIP